MSQFKQPYPFPGSQHCWSCTCYLKTEKIKNRVEEKSIKKLIDKYQGEFEHVDNIIKRELDSKKDFAYGIVKDFMINRAALNRILIDLKGLLDE